jgi:hypothetical protein
MLARMTDRIEYALESREVVAGYDERYWRFLIDKQREAGTELVMGRREGLTSDPAIAGGIVGSPEDFALQQRRKSTHHGN